MRFQPVQQAYAKAVGFTSTSNLVIENRNPNSYDTKYPIGQFWLNPLASALWFLNSQTSANAILQSEWIELEQDMSAVETFTVDAATAPGTNPVVPDGSNNITVTGGQSAPATISTVIRTNSLAANTWTTQIQQTSTNASKSTVLNGVSHFNSAQFTNDEGFVSVSGTGVGQTLTAQSGGPLSPTAGNWNIFGLGETTTSGAASTVSILSPRTAKFVVDPVLNVGTHQTITAALAAAVSGETIFVRPGIYTEDLTLKAGVDIVSFTAEGLTPNVTILGKLTASYSGTTSIAGIRLQTNGDNCLLVTGVSTILNITNCYILASNNTAISQSNGAILFSCSQGNITTTGIAFFALTGGTLYSEFTSFFNGGGSSTSNTNANGTLSFVNARVDSPITVSGTGSINAFGSSFSTPSGITLNQNSTAVVEMNVRNCFFISPNTSAISIGAGAQLTVDATVIRAGSVNGITGAGSVKAGDLVFEDVATGLNVATITTLAIYPPRSPLIQQVRQSTTNLATTTAVIPLDDSLPQSSEGTSYTTLNITPQGATNTLVFEFSAIVGISTAAASVILSFFEAAATDAFYAVATSVTVAGATQQIYCKAYKVAGSSGSPITYTIRYGTSNTLNAANINGSGGSHLFSTAMQAVFTITEYQ